MCFTKAHLQIMCFTQYEYSENQVFFFLRKIHSFEELKSKFVQKQLQRAEQIICYFS